VEAPRYVVRISGKTSKGASFNGTGFLVSPAGHVATCWHVVADAAEIRVHLPYPFARDEPALYEVRDALRQDDVALLVSRVPLEPTPIPCATLHGNWRADTGKQAAVTVWGFSGAEYYTAPQSFACTISGFSGQRGHIGLNGDINPGDSGAPVVNTEGKVVGIVDLKDRKRDGQAMALPVSLLLDLLTKNGVALAEEAEESGDDLPRLPSVSDNFTGRDAEVERVLGRLGLKRVVTLTGLGGIGKSEMARAVAHAARGQEWAAEGVLYVDLQSATSANEAQVRLRTDLGLQPAADAAALARQLGGNRLYVLDDLHQALVKDRRGVQALVRALHDYAAPARFLLTSRDLVGVSGGMESAFPLDRLPPPHDAELFRKLAEGDGYEWRDDDEEQRLPDLLRDLDGYPLAITIAASLLYGGSSLQTVVRQWRNRRTAALKVPGIEDADLDRLSSVDFSLALSFDTLPEGGDARVLFALFADLPAGATEETLEAMMGENGYDAVNDLVRRSLVQSRDGRYVMLVPVREFAAHSRTDACKPFLQKLDAHLLALAEHWCGDDAVFIPQLGEAVRLLSAELPNLHAAMDRAKARVDSRLLANLTVALRRFYTFALVGTEAKQRLEDGAVAARAIGDRLGEAHCIMSLGEVHGMLAEYEAARERYQEALPLFQSVGDRLGEATCIVSLGEVHRMLDEHEAARERYQEALPLFQSVGSKLGQANCIVSLGDVHRMLDEHEAARERYQEALPLFQSVGDRYSVAGTFRRLGQLCAAEGHPGEAARWMEQAAQIFRDIGVTHWANEAREQAEAWRREAEQEDDEPAV